MKVISKSTISGWNDQHSVDKMKHNHSLRQAVNPQKDLTRVKNPRRVAPAAAPRASQIRKILAQQPLPSGSAAAGGGCYTEYKNSIKSCAGNIIGRVVGDDENGTLADKIANSTDIQSILSEKILSMPDVVENEWLILGLTLTGKLLEWKCGV